MKDRMGMETLRKQTSWITVLKHPIAAAEEQNTENYFIQTEKVLRFLQHALNLSPLLVDAYVSTGATV